MTAAMARVAVVADPAPRKLRPVLPWFGELRKLVDLVAAAAGREDVGREPDRMLSVHGVAAHREPVAEGQVELPLHPADVGDEPFVDLDPAGALGADELAAASRLAQVLGDPLALHRSLSCLPADRDQAGERQDASEHAGAGAGSE